MPDPFCSLCLFHPSPLSKNLPFALSACTEAYSQPDEQYACHLGCQDQLPFAELRQEQVRDNTAFPNCLLVCFELCYVT